MVLVVLCSAEWVTQSLLAATVRCACELSVRFLSFC